MIKVGCCGWGSLIPKEFGFKDWKKKFKSKLQLYSKFFDTVEINSTFYRLPRETTAIKWRNQVNEEFVFSIKAFKGITHVEKFSNKSIKYWKQTEKIARVLNAKFILIQTPKSFKDSEDNIRKVKKFFDKISYDKIVVEFRGFSNKTRRDICKEYGTIDCVDPFNRDPIKQRIYYFRLHGKPPGKRMYFYKYKDKDLIKLKEIIPKNSWVYFNNVWMCEDAIRFKKIIKQKNG